MLFDQIVRDKFDKLPPGQKKVAEYLLENLSEFSFSTASKIGRKLDVSETTVIRLSYSLGFESFSHMQQNIQQQLLKSQNKSSVALEEEGSSHSEKVNPIANIIERDIAILKKMQSQLDMEDLWNAVDRLMEAEQVTVIGYRNSYPAAHWLYLKLSMLRDNVHLIPSNVNIYNEMLEPNNNSVFFLLSFPTYAKETLLFAEHVKKQGAKLITATDRALSPVGRMSDIVFTTEVNVSSHNLYSIASIISLLNVIVSGIEVKYESKITSRLQNLHKIYDQLGVFIE